MIILLKIIIAYAVYFIFMRTMSMIISIKKLNLVNDKKVRKLYIAATLGRTKKMDKLIKEGANVKYQVKNEKGQSMTILSWLLLYHPHSWRVRRSFRHLLKKGADPFILNIQEIHHRPERLTSVVQYASALQNSFFLKEILDILKPTPTYLNNHIDFDSPPVIVAAQANAEENFKLLLDYGIDYKWSYKSSAAIETMNLFRSLLLVTSGTGWNFIYWWLESGMDYSVKYDDIDFKSSKTKPYLFVKIEDDKGLPAVLTMGFHGGVNGVDYAQKILEFFSKEGIKINPKKRDGEKYITKNGEKVLMIQTKNGKWKPYKKTFAFFFNVYWVYNLTRRKWMRRILTCKYV